MGGTIPRYCAHIAGTIPRYCAHIAYEYLCAHDSEHLALFVYEVLENLSHSKCLHYAYFVSIFVSPENDTSPMLFLPKNFSNAKQHRLQRRYAVWYPGKCMIGVRDPRLSHLVAL